MNFLVRRLLLFPPLLVAISLATFILVRLAPGGPFDRERAPASPSVERALRERYHLDESVGRQYLRYLGLLWERNPDGGWKRVPGGLIAGDLGPSLQFRNHSVNDILTQALPVSASLGILAFVTAIVLGVPLGIAGATSRAQWGGRLAHLGSLGLICVPAFVIGPVLVLVFAIQLRLLPVALWEGPRHAVLPALTLALFFAGRVARLTREGLLDTLEAPFLVTARAKGLSEPEILWRHALRPALLPVVSYSGPLLADLLTGSFVVENLFQIPGVGVFLVNSTLSRDYPMVIGLALVYAALLLILNLIADLLYAVLDPRIRHA